MADLSSAMLMALASRATLFYAATDVRCGSPRAKPNSELESFFDCRMANDPATITG
jgi:hypothetical protein